ncbi:hypothetical protein [Micromonospora sp. NBC_01796]|uniref:hypothetical protein n=1 Tax=Micromonospora sp. NBC_01796 TaxID=2975987 RepID=UPI002DD84E2B|nr:hypothetical protein [Micromonospora sp. NBC_01796]WSA84211.1 hypothetical protein OIE47_28195 [Micromonospora sp. NBC_01796]
MTRRIVVIELRRSAALWIGVLAAAFAWAMTSDGERWDGLWMATVLLHHNILWSIWPLVLAAGAWQGRRDRAAGVTELLTSTPRPGAGRTAPLAAVLAGCLAGGYVLGLLYWLVRAMLAASYQPPGWYWPILVGALGVTAAALLGLGLGRLMPSRLTAPLLAVGAVVAIIVPQVLWEDAGSRALLLVPGYHGSTDDYSTVALRGVAGQAAWFVALAATGWALLVAGTRRTKLLAVLPAALGLAVALSVLPAADRAAPRDPLAVELVCADGEPRVCVTRLYEPVLPQLVDPARRALATLGRLPQPPTAVVQETGRYGSDVEQRRDTVHLSLTVSGDGTISTGAGSIEEDILDGAGTWKCGAADADADAWNRIDAARAAAGLWLRGATAAPEDLWTPVRELADRALATLATLPADVQVARVAAMRDAALDCRPDLYDVLTTT